LENLATFKAAVQPTLEHQEMPTGKDFMNIPEAAEYFSVHIQTLRRLARQKKIPCFKVGRDWRFRKEALIKWADKQGIAKPDEPRCSVLVIDDEEKVCKRMAEVLERLGCQVRFATTGEMGLELTAQVTPDLIFLDLKMPNMNGPEFLSRLRETEPTLPVVVVTGYPDSHLVHKAIQHPPVLLLPKPATQEQLERTLQSQFANKLRVGLSHDDVAV
jgi:excisionase family DNA binding protein